MSATAAPREQDVGFEGRGHELFIFSLLFTSAAACFVMVRMYVRIALRAVGKDDIAILASLLFSFAMAGASCAFYYGYGKAASLLTKTNRTKALQLFYVVQIIYKFTINLTKLSILLLYLRFFNEAIYIRLNYAVMGYVLIYAFCSILVTIIQCMPIARAWDKSIHGACISLEGFWYAGAVINISSDLMILVLPMPIIYKMHCPRPQKIGLAVVFLLGGFVCVTSLLRMTTLSFSSTAADAANGTMISTIWTIVEANTGIMCACSPMLKTPLVRLFPHIFSRSSSGSPWGASDPFGDIHSGPSAPSDGIHLGAVHPDAEGGNAVNGMNLDGGTGWEGGVVVVGGSRDRLVGGEGVPRGAISKTTDVDVRVHY